MKKSAPALILLFVFISACHHQKNNDPKSQDHLIMSVLWYQKATEMQAIYYQCFNWAKIRIDQSLEENENLNKAVVVDIDETMLDNSPFETRAINTGEGYSRETWSEWTSRANATALPGAVAFSHYAKEKGVEVFYISNRSVKDFDVTLENLKKEGFAYADSSHLLLKSNTSSKTLRRNKVKKDHEIILLIGDNLGDFSEIFEDRSDNYGFAAVEANKEKFGKKFIVLPNPMYGNWENEVFSNRRDLTNQEKYNLRKESLRGY
mgnify:CR=1 FL=1